MSRDQGYIDLDTVSGALAEYCEAERATCGDGAKCQIAADVEVAWSHILTRLRQ